MKLSEHKLIKITFVSFILLFLLVYIIDLNYKLTPIPISEIDKTKINKRVAIKVEVASQNLHGNTLFLTLSDKNNEIKAVIFNQNELLELQGEYYFLGKISLYNNELELIVDEIKKSL